jgi:hypothetical protein
MKVPFCFLFMLCVSFSYAQKDKGVHVYSDSDSKVKTKKDKKGPTYQRDSTGRRVRGYTALTFTLGMHPTLKRYGGTASVDYNYTQADYNNGGNISYPNADFSKQFTSRRFLTEIGFLGWEKNLRYRYTEIKTGILMGKHGGALYLAYGMGFRKELGEGKSAIRLGVSFFYTGRVTQIGKIDNNQKDIVIDNVVFYKFFVTHGKYGSYHYDASYIRNSLNYNCFGIKPRISIEFFPESRKSSFRFNVGYNVVLSEKTTFVLQQYGKNGGGSSGTHHTFNLSDPYLNYTFTGSSQKHSPYAMNGLFINLELSCKIKTLYKK